MKTTYDLRYSKLDWLVIGAIFAFPLFFMTVRHAVHVPLFFLLLLLIYQGLTKIPVPFGIQTRQDVFTFFVFSSLFLAVLISQLFRGAIYFPAFDGPFRVMIAGVAFLFLKQWNLPYIKILGAAIPLGLILTFITLKIHPEVFWGERYATYFVDPNTLGSQSFILGLLSLLMIRPLKYESIYLFLLKLIGGLIGLYISVGSASRGAWLTAPFIFFMIFIFRIGDINSAPASCKQKMWLQTIAIVFAVFSAGLASFFFSEKLSTRIISAYFEITNWFSGANLEGSAGIRLSMWKFSFEFAKQSLLFGYGEEKNMLMTLKNSPLNIPANQVAITTMAGTGPHSDILSKLLSAGITGLTAYFLILLAPSFMFWQHRNSKDTDKKIASRIGIYYIVGIFIAGLSNEQLSLKYLCTFYGLMIATLLAHVLCQATAKNPNPSYG
jgi:O-antigen ligase